jgi:NAD+ diphosphatase
MANPGRRRNVYEGLVLDRAAERRRDKGWIAERLAHPATRILPVWRERNLIRHGGDTAPLPAWLTPEAARAIGGADAEFVLLGVADDVAHFALSISHLEEPAAIGAVGPHGALADLRAIGALLPEGDAAMLAYGRAITTWHNRHRYCGICGHATRSEEGGHTRRCTNGNCAASHFPRTDPAVIMAIEHEDRLLLARQFNWPAGMYSVLAGFVEPGESLEETVARESYEEAGIRVTDIRYHSSQPWPFPASIMLGFTARALSGAARAVEADIESIGWYDRESLRNSPEDETFKLPTRHSIARRLVEDWIAAGD